MFRRSLFALLTVMSANLFSQNYGEINLDPGYCSGEIEVANPFGSGMNILFSNGIELAFFGDLDNQAMHYSGEGGVMVSDSTTKLYFKKEGEQKFLKSGYLSEDHKWQFIFNGNKWDSIWDSSLFVPNERLSPDSVAYEENSEIKISQAAFLFSASGSELPDMFPITHEYMNSNYNSIFYLEGNDGRNVKMQVFDYSIDTYTSGPDENECSVISYLKIKWAADSSGNGRFAKDGTANKVTFSKASRISPLETKIMGNGVTFINNLSKSSNVQIFSLNGKLMNNLELTELDRSVFVDIQKGVYVIKITTDNSFYTNKLTIR